MGCSPKKPLETPETKVKCGEYSTSSSTFPMNIKFLQNNPCFHCKGNHINDLDLYNLNKHWTAKPYSISNPITCPKLEIHYQSVPWRGPTWEKWANDAKIPIINKKN